MSNPILDFHSAHTRRKTTFNNNSVGFIIDVDDCIVEVDKHTLEPWQTDLLNRLYTVTNGAVCFLTNNTGKSVHAMHSGIPCISEFGMVERWNSSTPELALPDNTPHLNINEITAFVTNENVACEYQPKEASVCFMFHNSDEQAEAENIAFQIFTHFGLAQQNYTMVTLKDSVEITPKGTAKVNAIPRIQEKTEFKNLDIIVLGDSGTDHDCMIKTGYGIAVGDSIPNGDYLLGRVADHSKTWDVLQKIVTHLERGHDFSLKDVFPKAPAQASARGQKLAIK